MLKHNVGMHIEKNAFVDKGDGVVEFPRGLVITDNSSQRNGTKYDIKSMDISEYKGQVTADHRDSLQTIIAKVDGIEKKGNKIVINAIKYAVDINPLARLAYDLLVNGFSTDFSIETFGPWPNDEDDTYYDAKLIGLSQVVVGNNRSATVNAIVQNSLNKSKEDGLDVKELEDELLTEFHINAVHKTDKKEDDKKTDNQAQDKPDEDSTPPAPEKTEEVVPQPPEETPAVLPTEIETPEEKHEVITPTNDEQKNNKKEETDEMKFVTIKNSRDFPVTVTYKNAAGDDSETVLEPGKTVDVSDDQRDSVQTQVDDAEKPQEAPAPAPAEEEEAPADNSTDVSEIVKNAVAEAAKGFSAEITALKTAFNKSAQEPGFKPAGAPEKAENEFSKLDYRERHGKQINAAWEYLKLGRAEAAQTLNDINQVNLEKLQEAGKVSNSLAISDFGNFVISPELLTDIQGFRNDYTALIDATDWRETNALEFAWLKRSGDINMQNVGLEPGGTNNTGDGNLKPISTYTAEPVTSKLEELAAVTPVVNAATRFLAVDLLGDVARGYRNDYDRKRAQLVVARLQQAVSEAGNEDHVIDYTVGTNAESLVAWSQLWGKVAESTVNGTFIFNLSTMALIQQAALQAGTNGPLSQVFTTGSIPTIFGRPYLVVPNDILPTLGSGDTVTVVVDGDDVVIDNAVFYCDLSNFTGRTSGGLQYDLSTEASYEQNGVTKSAYQRNELVLRGSFFRGGAVLDTSRVSAMSSAEPVAAS